MTDVSYDAELYQQLAHESGGPIFELGVGTGRLAIPLALAGHEVVGIDSDPAMLERARRDWRRVRGDMEAGRLVVRDGDIRSFRPGARFGLAFIAVNTLLLMEDDAARLAVLETMYSSLRHGGIAAVEMSTPGEAELAGYDGRLHLEWLREDPVTGHQVSKTMSARHDPDSSSVTLTQVFDSTPAAGGPLTRVSRVDTLHLVTPARLAGLAGQVGFTSVDLRGDHLATRYGARSHRAILVARKV